MTGEDCTRHDSLGQGPAIEDDRQRYQSGKLHKIKFPPLQTFYITV